MSIAALWDVIDLLIIPAMDGRDDFTVAMDLLESIHTHIDPKKIIFSFNRYNAAEYPDFWEQFDSFARNVGMIKKEYKIDLGKDENYFVLKDSRAVKRARSMGVSVKSLVDQDVIAVTSAQRAEKDTEKRLELTRQRGLIMNAQSFYNDCIIPMVSKVQKKLG